MTANYPLRGGEADKQIRTGAYSSVRVLQNLPQEEMLSECTMCLEVRDKLVQLAVIGHQVALCGPCVRKISHALEVWSRGR